MCYEVFYCETSFVFNLYFSVLRIDFFFVFNCNQFELLCVTCLYSLCYITGSILVITGLSYFVLFIFIHYNTVIEPVLFLL